MGKIRLRCSYLCVGIMLMHSTIFCQKSDLRNEAVAGRAKCCSKVVIAEQCNQSLTSYPLTKSDVKHRAHNGSHGERYDIIICGAGTAGSLLAFRMAERYPKAKILVLECGKDDIQDNKVIRTAQEGPNPNKVDANPLVTDDWGQLIRGVFGAFGEGAFSIQQTSRSTTSDDYIPQQKILGMARGMTLGGTSASNVQVWNRGTKKGTYDKWQVATQSADFGWQAMNEAYKKLENRSQVTRYYNQQIPYWLPEGTPGFPPSRIFNPNYQGNSGNIYLTQAVLAGYTNRAVKEIVASGIQPGRALPIDLDAEDPNNPDEYLAPDPLTQYDQSDLNFPSYNPYPLTTPGVTYMAPDGSNSRGPEYASIPQKLGGALLKKSLQARCFAAPAYLYPLIYNKIPHNVTIKTQCYITKLIFNNKKIPLECTGVEYVENGWQVANVARAIRRDDKPWINTYSNVDRNLCTIDQAAINQAIALAGGIKKAYAAADIWLCMGAIDTPAILQRSGVGPKEVLENLNYSPVKTLLDLPGVGQNVQDTCDMPVGYYTELDLNTYLPSYTGAPASAAVPIYAAIFGLADPTNPNDLFGSSTISGAAVGYGFEESRIRVKSNPSLEKFDFDIVAGDFPINLFNFGNLLWDDMLSFFQNKPSTWDITSNKLNLATYDRSKEGQYLGTGQLKGNITSVFAAEYWGVQSKGEVRITSGNVFDRPMYAPNMLANENDLEAFENNFQNNILPIGTKLAAKRFGPRGPFTYAFALGSGGYNATTTTVQLGASVTASLFKPVTSAYHISQANYDAVNGMMINAELTIASGPAAVPGNNSRKIIAWSGNTGNPATSYIATLSAPLVTAPNSADLYALALANEAPLDSVEFNDDNHRNFVRFVQPNGDNVFSDINVQILPQDPIITAPSSTRVTVNAPNHQLVKGEMIKISGVNGPVDNIGASEFNEYHVVDRVLNANQFQIVLFWNKTILPGMPNTDQSPTPSPAAGALGGVGGGSGIKLHTLKFDRVKFREWLYTAYFSGWHPGSSCRMGVATNSQSVVDTRGRVYNTRGIRICDAAIFPTKPDGNTQAPVYGITQRMFELVSSQEYDKFF